MMKTKYMTDAAFVSFIYSGEINGEHTSLEERWFLVLCVCCTYVNVIRAILKKREDLSVIFSQINQS